MDEYARKELDTADAVEDGDSLIKRNPLIEEEQDYTGSGLFRFRRISKAPRGQLSVVLNDYSKEHGQTPGHRAPVRTREIFQPYASTSHAGWCRPCRCVAVVPMWLFE